MLFRHRLFACVSIGLRLAAALTFASLSLRSSELHAGESLEVRRVEYKKNIAYFHIGLTPIRVPGVDPFLPQPGIGDSEWLRIIDAEKMPHAINPSQGWMANWTNKPAPEWKSPSAEGFRSWGPVHRVNTLHSLLSQVEPGSATIETMNEINRLASFTTDTPSGNQHPVAAPTTLDDLPSLVDTDVDPRLAPVVTELENWNFLQFDQDSDGRYDAPAVAIFNAWWTHLVERIFSDELGASAEHNTSSNPMKRLLDSPEASMLSKEKRHASERS